MDEIAPFRRYDDVGTLGTFADALAAAELTELNRRLTAAVTEAVKVARDLEAKAVITVKLDIVPDDDGTVTFVPTVTSKLPVRRIRNGRLYALPDGRLSQYDPMQPTLSANPRKV